MAEKRAPRKKPKLVTRLNPDKVSEILACVAFKGPTETVADICKRYGISERTLFRLKRRSDTDSTLAAAVKEKKVQLAQGWKDVRVRFLRDSIEKLGQLVQLSTPAPGVIREVAGSIKIVGDLEAVAKALGVDDDVQQSRNDREGQVPPEAQGGGGREAEGGGAGQVH